MCRILPSAWKYFQNTTHRGSGRGGQGGDRRHLQKCWEAEPARAGVLGLPPARLSLPALLQGGAFGLGSVAPAPRPDARTLASSCYLGAALTKTIPAPSFFFSPFSLHQLRRLGCVRKAGLQANFYLSPGATSQHRGEGWGGRSGGEQTHSSRQGRAPTSTPGIPHLPQHPPPPSGPSRAGPPWQLGQFPSPATEKPEGGNGTTQVEG